MKKLQKLIAALCVLAMLLAAAACEKTPGGEAGTTEKPDGPQELTGSAALVTD